MFMSPLCGKTIFYHSTLAETDGRGENKIQSRISASVLLKVFCVCYGHALTTARSGVFARACARDSRCLSERRVEK